MSHHELLPCPFCDGKAVWDCEEGLFGCTIDYIECEKCKCRTYAFDFKKDSIKAWNARNAKHNPFLENK